MLSEFAFNKTNKRERETGIPRLERQQKEGETERRRELKEN